MGEEGGMTDNTKKKDTPFWVDLLVSYLGILIKEILWPIVLPVFLLLCLDNEVKQNKIDLYLYTIYTL